MSENPKPSSEVGAKMRNEQERTRRPVNDEDFRTLSELGRGAFGTIHLVQHTTTGQTYAKKTMAKECYVQRSARLRCLYAERKITAESKHPFILKLQFAYQTPRQLVLVTEYLPGGNIFERIDDVGGALPIEQTKFYTAQLVMAVGYLHRKFVIHRDLKVDNIMIQADGYIKLIDFGIAKILPTSTARTFTMCGGLEYMAPEMWHSGGQPPAPTAPLRPADNNGSRPAGRPSVTTRRGYGLSVDWWSMGVSVYAMATGRLPFSGDNLAVQIASKEMDNEGLVVGSPLQRLLRKLLRKKPETRLGCGPKEYEEFMTQDFFVGLSFLALLEKKVTPPYIPPAPRHDADEKTDSQTAVPASTNSSSSSSSQDYEHFKNFDFSLI